MLPLDKYLPQQRLWEVKTWMSPPVKNEPLECARPTELLRAIKGPQVNSDGPVCIFSEELYMLPAPVGHDSNVMEPNHAEEDTCSGSNLPVRRCLPQE